MKNFIMTALSLLTINCVAHDGSDTTAPGIPTCFDLGAPSTLLCHDDGTCMYEGQECLGTALPDCSIFDQPVTACDANGICKVAGVSCVMNAGSDAAGCGMTAVMSAYPASGSADLCQVTVIVEGAPDARFNVELHDGNGLYDMRYSFATDGQSVVFTGTDPNVQGGGLSGIPCMGEEFVADALNAAVAAGPAQSCQTRVDFPE